MEVTSKFHKLWEGYLRDRLFIVCFFAVLYYYASDQLTLVPGVRVVPLYFCALFAVAEILDREYSYPIACKSSDDLGPLASKTKGDICSIASA